MLKKIFANKRLLGIDVSTNSVRLLELNKVPSGLQIVACAEAAIEGDFDNPINIANAIKTAFATTKSTTTNAAIALSHSATISKNILLQSQLTDDELPEFLNYNIEKYLGSPPHSVGFDFQVIKPLQIKITATRKERIDKCINILRLANLRPKIIDIDSLALARAVCHQQKDNNNPIAIANLDYGTILFCIIHHYQLLYAHKNSIDEFNLQTPTQITEAITRSLQDSLATTPQAPQQLIISGTKTIGLNLIDNISAVTGLPTQLANPFLNMTFNKSINAEKWSKLAPAMMLCCGLALRRFEDGSS